MSPSLVNFIGTRGTHPSSGQGTMSFIVDNRFVFDICPEFVSSFYRFVDSWNFEKENKNELESIKILYGRPSFGKLEHIFLSHLHYDHWGGLRHFLIWTLMFQFEQRIKTPLHIYVPAKSTDILLERLCENFNLDIRSSDDAGEFLKKILAIDVGPEINRITKFHEIHSGDIIKFGDYQVEANENKHITGSLAFKIHLVKHKLRIDALKGFNIPQGPLLSKLQRQGVIEHNNQIIELQDLFDEMKITLGYSGDTLIDSNLLQWFDDTHLLLYETSYLTSNSSHHTDFHTELSEELTQNLSKMTNLKAFFPIHISQRYKWKKIEEIIDNYRKNYSQWIWHAAKTGDVVLFTFNDKEPKILSLSYFYQF
ncbi:MAG: MBL fold metallo-hydrolase [Candidatus Hodarchaeales archaeon]